MNAQYHNFWRRLGASIIDGMVISPATTPPVLAIGYGPPWLAYLAIVVLVPVPWAYTTICHGRWGQTLGKHVTEIRVVRADTLERISYGRALRRDAGTVLLGVLGAFVFIYAVRNGDTDAYRIFDAPEVRTYKPGEEPTPGELFRDSFGAAFPSLSQLVVTALSSLWGLAEVLTMLTNQRRRALHDYIGGTVVIHDPTPREVTIGSPSPLVLEPEASDRPVAADEAGRIPDKSNHQRGTGW